MASGLIGRVLSLVPIAALLAVAIVWRDCRAECLPTRGTFEGIYRQDRWGVCRFSFFLVSPELHQQLKKYSNQRIRLEVLEAHQPANPGDAIIRRIGKITELENSQVTAELKMQSTAQAVRGNVHQIDLTFFLKNDSDKPVELSLQDVHPSVRMQAVGDPPSDQASDFPGYTVGQLHLKSKSFATFNNHLSASLGSIENGHHVRIAARQRFPIVVNYDLELGEYEIGISARPFLSLDEPGKLPGFAQLFDVNLDEDTVRREREKSKLRLENVKWVRAHNQWNLPCVRLSFVVAAARGDGRSIVLCPESDRRPLAGTLTTAKKSGDRVQVEVDPCYDCSNLGEIWELVRIPDDGIASSLIVSLGRPGKPIELPKQVRLQLLTDQGLESFELDVPSAQTLDAEK